MKMPLALRAFILCTLVGPLWAGQIEGPVSGEFAPGAQSGAIGSNLGSPVPLQLTVLPLVGATAPNLAPTFAPAPSVIPVAAALAVAPTPAQPNAVRPLTATQAVRPTASSLHSPTQDKTRANAADTLASPEGDVDKGRVMFDQAPQVTGDASAHTAGFWSSLKPSLARGNPARSADSTVAAQATRSVKERITETTELGFFLLGLQLVSGLIFMIAGAHATYPVLAGALWALGGVEMIKHLGSLRSVIVGGWQASHDQKMRHDYATGKLKDIRGHKYGEDRYDKYLPGPISARERTVIDTIAVLAGVPWVLGGGPAAISLYLVSAVSATYLRRVWQRNRPQPKTATAKDAVFERDR